MSEEAQVLEPEVQEEPKTTDEVQEVTEEQPEEKPQEPELTPDERIKKLESDVAGKQKAIDRQTKRYYEAQEKQQAVQQENERMLSQLKETQPEKEPSIDDYDTHEEYVDALVDYKAKGQFKVQQEKFMLEQQQAQADKVHNERVVLRQSQETEYMVDNPMYKASVNEVDSYLKTLNASGGTQEAVVGQLYRGNVPQIIDYFGSNNGEHLDELGKISRMSPPEAAVEVYKIQQKLSSPVKQEKKTKPTPIKPLEGKSKGSPVLVKRSGKDVLDWVKS